MLKGYYVGYRAAESSQPYSFKTVETVVNGSQEVTLVGLTKSSRYSVIVKAFNAIGSGPPSEALLVRTLDGGRYKHTHMPVNAASFYPGAAQEACKLQAVSSPYALVSTLQLV